MKFWRVDYHCDDTPSGEISEWFGTLADAWARMRALDAEFTDDDGGTTAGYFRAAMPVRVDVPTTRRALLAFLNSNASIR